MIVGAIIFVARKQHTAAEEYEAAREKRCSASSLDPKQQDACKYKRDGPQNYLPWWYVLVAWPEGITVWAIIFTLIVIAKQTSETRKAAEAALLNAQTVINAERAWIAIRVESPGPNSFQFKAVNVGNTPAKIISIHGRWLPVNRRDTLQLPPDEELNGCLISTPPCFLPPTVSCDAFQCNIMDAHGEVSAEEWMNHLRLPLVDVFFFGKIRYYDVINAEPKVLHETKWLYWLPPFENALPIPDPSRPQKNEYS